MILPAKESLSQSTKKTDTTSAYIEGSQTEIDSALKILNDYPDLVDQHELLRKTLKDERLITASERAAILKILNLEGDWDIKKVKRRIRRYKILRPILWALGSFSAGVTIAVLKR